MIKVSELHNDKDWAHGETIQNRGL
jgi:hypothetical protein